MKKTTFLYTFICSLLMISLVSCKSTNSPKAVTETFLISLARLDFATVKTMATPETWSFLKILDEETKNLSLEEREDYIKDFKVKVLATDLINDSTYLVKFETTPSLLPINEFNLNAEKDIEGNIKWKVNISTLAFLESDTTLQETMVSSFEDEVENIDTLSQKTAIKDSTSQNIQNSK